MLKKFYRRYIAPRDSDEDTRNRELVLNVLLVGAAATMLAALLALLHTLLIVGDNSVTSTILSVLFMLGVTGVIYALSRSGKHKLAALLFILLYLLIAIGASITWSLGMPSSVALFGLIVVLCGILLGARYSLYGFFTVVGVFVVLKLLEINSVYEPDLTWTNDPSGGDELIGTCLVLGVIAIVSWLFNFRMERSLHRAERAERALKRQKQMLEHTVEKRTQELQAAQLEKVQELYRFAELGQLSTALMHDLANHLTTLTLDIESLGAEHRSSMLQRAKRSMRYIDEMVLQVRDQLRGKGRSHVFNVATEVKAVINILRHKADQAEVAVFWQAPKSQGALQCKGDTLRFRQLLANLISNAIDAYEPGKSSAKRQVLVYAERKGRSIALAIEDHGKGIDPKLKDKLFEPFYGNKKGGLGLGLFIAKQIAQDHFAGDIKIDTAKNKTVFTVTLKAHV